MTPPPFSAGGQHPPTPRHTREQIAATFDAAERALHDGTITRAEYEYYLTHEFGTTERSRVLQQRTTKKSTTRTEGGRKVELAPTTLILIVGIMVGLLTIALFGNTLTGFVARGESAVPTDGLTFSSSANVTLNITNTTLVRVSGTLEGGDGNVTLLVNGTEYPLWSGSPRAPDYDVSTPYESYALNESVNVSLTPENATNVTLWLIEESGERSPFTNGDRIAQPGSYTLDALFTDAKASTTFSVRNDTNTSRNRARPPAAPLTQFTDVCGEACVLNETGNKTLTLSVELAEDATLTLTDITVTQPRHNTAPTLNNPLTNVALVVGEERSIALDEHFSDADGDSLVYDVLHVPGTTMTVTESTLTIVGERATSGESRVYASDAEALTESNAFLITVAGGAPNGTTNATENETKSGGADLGGAEADGDEPATPSNETPAAVGGPDCSHPNPNKRPVECLQERTAEYFQPQELYLTTPGRKEIARFTPIGNMVITGDIIEGSTATPNRDDYQVGYEDSFGDFVATAWIDERTGDLHLRGTLHEEQTNNVPDSGSFVLRNQRGVVVAWADQRAGDLFVRGMVVQRRSVG